MIAVCTYGNARERYEAMKKGKPVPARDTETLILSDELIERLGTELAKIYKEDVKNAE